MKKILFLLMLLACVYANGQSVQYGYVEEYNGTKEKTPLGGVNIVAGGASAKSGADGRFKLTFNTLKVGDRVNADINNVAILKGYILFNKEAVEQWTVTGKSVCFRIVLCKRKKFNDLVHRYYNVGDSSYRMQLKREQERVNQMMREGEIQQQEYERLLREADERYQRAFKALSENAELVARIDESELDEEQEHILQLAKEGKIDEAAKLIRESDIIERFDKAQEKGQYAGQQREYYEQKVEESQNEQERLMKRLAENERIALAQLSVDSANCSAKEHLVMSYLFQGRYDDAEKIALEIKNKEYDGKLIKEHILGELRRLEEKGVIPEDRKADVERLRTMLK